MGQPLEIDSDTIKLKLPPIIQLNLDLFLIQTFLCLTKSISKMIYFKYKSYICYGSSFPNEYTNTAFTLTAYYFLKIIQICVLFKKNILI